MITVGAKIYLSNGDSIDLLPENTQHRYIQSISASTFERDSINSPSFGIISNKGSIEIIDAYGRWLNQIKKYKSVDGNPCELYIINTLNSLGACRQKISTMYAKDWKYDNVKKILYANLTDGLEEWQEINVDGISLDTSIQHNVNLKLYYDYLYSKTPSKFKMLSWGEIAEHAGSALTQTYIKYPFLKKGTLWQQWNKLCQIAQCHIYRNFDGNTIFRYNGGN